MWLRNRRSVFLLQTLHRLMLQIEGTPAALVEVKDAMGNAAGGVVVGPGPLGTTDMQGQIWIPSGIRSAASADHRLTVTDMAGKAVRDHTVSVRLIPQRTQHNVRVPGVPGSTPGEFTVPIPSSAPSATASVEARVFVKDAATKAPVPGKLRRAAGELALDANGSAILRHPFADEDKSDMVFTVLDAGGSPAAARDVEVEFVRNTAFDRVITGKPTDSNGHVPLALSRAMAIAGAVVKHPLIARTPLPGPLPKIPPFRNRDGEVVEREELVRIVLELAAGDGAGSVYLDEEKRADLQRLLGANGIPSAGTALSNIRKEVQNLEESEPQSAAHVRHTKATVLGAKSDFVGKVTQWFDTAMARATQQYAAEARAVTVAAALVVALAVQLDSIQLLRRLSADPALRTGLLTEATRHEERIKTLNDEAKKKTADAAATKDDAEAAKKKAADAAATEDELEGARRVKAEIDQNLAILRAPGLDILPDHFIWQPRPTARLDTNPYWTPRDYSKSFEFVVGGTSYTVRPEWRRSVVVDVRDAIDRAGAPVTTSIDAGDACLIRAREPVDFHVRTSAQRDLAEPMERVALTRLTYNPRWPDTIAAPAMRLVIDQATYDFALDAGRDQVLSKIADVLHQRGLAVWCRAGSRRTPCQSKDPKTLTSVVIVAATPAVKDIRLLWNKDDGLSNVLDDVWMAPKAWRVRSAPLQEAGRVVTVSWDGAKPFVVGAKPRKRLAIAELTSAINEAAAKIKTAGQVPLAASMYRGDALVINARRRGDVELRHTAGRREANVLSAGARTWPITELFTAQSLVGVGLTWVLLSLGAPFWFDALKNLLKLRPAAAAAEERNRTDRTSQKEAPPKAGKKD